MIEKRRDPKLHWKAYEDGVAHAYAVFYDSERRPKRKWVASGIADAEAAHEWHTDIKRAWRRDEFDPWKSKRQGELGMQQVIEKYFHANPQLKETTVVTRRATLERFARLLPAGLTMGYLDRDHVERFLDTPSERLKRPISLRTKHSYLNTLRFFFTWCVGEGYIRDDPASTIKLPRLGRRTPEFLTPIEYTRLENAIDTIYEERRSREDPRYRIADDDFIWIKDPIRLALATGLRISDVLRLTWDQVRLDAGIIEIDDRTKTGNEYSVPILPLAAQVLHKRLEDRKAPGEKGEDLVFRSQKHYRGTRGSMSRGNLQNHFRKARMTARLPKNISFHSLRHTYATWMLIQTNDIRLVSSLLGHTSLEQTKDYAHAALLARRQIGPEQFERLGVSWTAWMQSEQQGEQDEARAAQVKRLIIAPPLR